VVASSCKVGFEAAKRGWMPRAGVDAYPTGWYCLKGALTNNRPSQRSLVTSRTIEVCLLHNWPATSRLTIFCRIHRSIRMTPAMESGITDHVWELTELLADSERPTPKKRMNNTHQ